MDQGAFIKSLHEVNFDPASSSFLHMQEETPEKGDLLHFQCLKSLVPHMKSEDGLKNLTYFLVRKMSDVLDDLIKDKLRSEQAFHILKDFWALCFCQRSTLPRSRNASAKRELDFVEVLPSLASLYMDLAISTHGNKESSKGVSRQLYSAMCFDLSPRCLKTALLEVSQCSAVGAQLLKPLLKKLLVQQDQTASPMTALEYLLHTVALRRWTLVSEALREKAQEMRPIKAPAKFVSWLSQHWPRTMEYFPLDKSLKGRWVTEVMLSLDNAAIEELINVFSECLWATKTGGKQKEVKEQEVAMETESTEELFVIDKSGTDVCIEERHLPSKKRKRKLSEDDTSAISALDGEDLNVDEVTFRLPESVINKSSDEFVADSDVGMDEDDKNNEVDLMNEEEDEGEDENSDEEKEDDDGGSGSSGCDGLEQTTPGTIYKYVDEDDKRENDQSWSNDRSFMLPEPRRQCADGMEVTVYTQDSEEDDTLRLEDQEVQEEKQEEKRTPQAVVQTLRSIRQASGHRKSTKHSQSQSESEEVVPSHDTLSHWLRSSPRKSLKPAHDRYSERGQSVSDDKALFAKETSARKSAADFFNESSEEESEDFTAILPAPHHQELTPTESSFRIKSSNSNQTEKAFNISDNSTTAHLQKRSNKKTSTSKKDKLAETPLAVDDPLETKSKALSEPLVHNSKKQRLETPRTAGKRSKAEMSSAKMKRKQQSVTPRRQYYLRNLTEEFKASPEKLLREDGSSASPMTALKKQKRKESKSELQESPKKSPANRRKSLRSACKAP